MNMTLNKRWCLTAILALSAVVYTSSSFAATDRQIGRASCRERV